MIDQSSHVKAVIGFRIAQLFTYFNAGFSAPGKLNRRQTPCIVDLRRGVGDGICSFRADVTRTARDTLGAYPAFSCDDVHTVQTVCAIAKVVPRGPPAFSHMAIRAARMRGDSVNPLPSGSAAILRVGTHWHCKRYEGCKGFQTKSTVWKNGISRKRFPVAAKIALAKAGAAGGTGGSPMPRMDGLFSKPRTSITGH